MPVPEDYTNLKAHEDSIQKAREAKQDLGLTWNDFLEHAAKELTKA
jgi:hypothetical protein